MKDLIKVLPVLCAVVFWSSCTGGQSAAVAEKVQAQITGSCQIIELLKTERIQIFELRYKAGQMDYAVVNKARSKSGVFTVMTHFSSELSIIKVEILRYPHSRGRMVTRPTFLKQFIKWDTCTKIDAVTGATSSSDATTTAVKKAQQALRQHLS
ncbi:MAG: FMN-binding protein [Kiritimatiellae bacterium]|jgi:hypothetical protein|nr:FMN-binding protein [Kiritimatiellia bacterium]